MITLKSHKINLNLKSGFDVNKEFEFMKYKFDVKRYRKVLRKFKFDNLIIIGYGGSINSFKAIYYALKDKVSKRVFIVDTVEPEYLTSVARQCSKNNTLIIAVSKSGNTISLIEDLIFFMNKGFKNIITITSGGALEEISNRMNFEVFNHPNIGGRFAGLTECALIPSMLLGLNVNNIIKGARGVYNNKTLRVKIFSMAKSFFELEKMGYTEIFAPAYSNYLAGINLLATQLVHETTGKDGLGQTILTTISPESQHETNQRFFGGRKNMIGLFTIVKHHRSVQLKVLNKIKNVDVDGLQLGHMDRLSLADSISYEADGVIKTAEKFKIPFVKVSIDKLNESSIGELIAFWQLFSVYSAIVRKQNPFDQPEVEHSKLLTARLIKNNSGRGI